jgi:hypothetical protein
MSGPTKFNAQAREEYIRRIRSGGRRGATARAMKVSTRTVQKAMRRWNKETGLSEPTAFGEAVLEAEREADEPVEDALYWQATLRADTASALKARIFWLTNRQSGRWREAKALTAEVSGSGGSSVQHSFELDPHAKQELFDKINQMRANLSRSRDLPGMWPALPVETAAREEPDQTGREPARSVTLESKDVDGAGTTR